MSARMASSAEGVDSLASSSVIAMMPAHFVMPVGTLGYFVRPGKHSMTRDDWRCYLYFARAHLQNLGDPDGF